jgi:hypothetical protein
LLFFYNKINYLNNLKIERDVEESGGRGEVGGGERWWEEERGGRREERN